MARYYVAGVSKIIAGITKKSAFKFSIEWKAHLNVQKSGAALQVKSQKDSAKYWVTVHWTLYPDQYMNTAEWIQKQGFHTYFIWTEQFQ